MKRNNLFGVGMMVDQDKNEKKSGKLLENILQKSFPVPDEIGEAKRPKKAYLSPAPIS